MEMPAIPVWIVPDNELVRNGGTIPILGQAAVPITNPPVDLLISTDANNQLEEGSDGKLFVPAGGGAGLPYAVYIASLVQVGEGVPIPTIYYNNLGFVPEWTYQEDGLYPLLSDAHFTVGKTQVILTDGFQNNISVSLWAIDYADASYIEIVANSPAGSGMNDWKAQVEIRIFP